MFRLNGDITIQLERIYELNFILKYKNDLKDRMLLFINSIISKNTLTLEYLKELEKEIIFKNNEPYKLTNKFFKKYKTDLLNSFNPIWYKEYNKKETMDLFIKKAFEKIKIKIKEEKIKLNTDKLIDEEFKTFEFSKKRKNKNMSLKNFYNLIDYIQFKVENNNFIEKNFESPDRYIRLDISDLNKCFLTLIYYNKKYGNYSKKESVGFPLKYKEKEINIFKKNELIEPWQTYIKKDCVELIKDQIRFYLYNELCKLISEYLNENKMNLNTYYNDLPF